MNCCVDSWGRRSTEYPDSRPDHAEAMAAGAIARFATAPIGNITVHTRPLRLRLPKRPIPIDRTFEPKRVPTTPHLTPAFISISATVRSWPHRFVNPVTPTHSSSISVLVCSQWCRPITSPSPPNERRVGRGGKVTSESTFYKQVCRLSRRGGTQAWFFLSNTCSVGVLQPGSNLWIPTEGTD